MDESYFPPRLSGFFIFLLLVVVLLSSIVFIYNRAAPTPEPITNHLPKPTVNPSPTLAPPPKASGCKTGGCSGELCMDVSSPDRATICLYRVEYTCLKYSVCERQPNGNCGWTQTPQYLTCLQNL